MKKFLTIFSLIIISFSGLLMFGCRDKYENISLSLYSSVNLDEADTLILYLGELSEGEYDRAEITAKVKGADKNFNYTSMFSSTFNNIRIDNALEMVDGGIKKSIIATSMGDDILQVVTAEGGKTEFLKVRVIKKATAINFADNLTLSVVKGSQTALPYNTFSLVDSNENLVKEFTYSLQYSESNTGVPPGFSINEQGIITAPASTALTSIVLKVGFSGCAPITKTIKVLDNITDISVKEVVGSTKTLVASGDIVEFVQNSNSSKTFEISAKSSSNLILSFDNFGEGTNKYFNINQTTSLKEGDITTFTVIVTAMSSTSSFEREALYNLSFKINYLDYSNYYVPKIATVITDSSPYISGFNISGNSSRESASEYTLDVYYLDEVGLSRVEFIPTNFYSVKPQNNKYVIYVYDAEGNRISSLGDADILLLDASGNAINLSGNITKNGVTFYVKAKNSTSIEGYKIVIIPQSYAYDSSPAVYAGITINYKETIKEVKDFGILQEGIELGSEDNALTQKADDKYFINFAQYKINTASNTGYLFAVSNVNEPVGIDKSLITIKSENNSVVYVEKVADGKFKLIPQKAGETTLTVSSKNLPGTYSINVEVYYPVQDYFFALGSVNGSIGKIDYDENDLPTTVYVKNPVSSDSVSRIRLDHLINPSEAIITYDYSTTDDNIAYEQIDGVTYLVISYKTIEAPYDIEFTINLTDRNGFVITKSFDIVVYNPITTFSVDFTRSVIYNPASLGFEDIAEDTDVNNLHALKLAAANISKIAINTNGKINKHSFAVSFADNRIALNSYIVESTENDDYKIIYFYDVNGNGEYDSSELIVFILYAVKQVDLSYKYYLTVFDAGSLFTNPAVATLRVSLTDDAGSEIIKYDNISILKATKISKIVTNSNELYFSLDNVILTKTLTYTIDPKTVYNSGVNYYAATKSGNSYVNLSKTENDVFKITNGNQITAIGAGIAYLLLIPSDSIIEIDINGIPTNWEYFRAIKVTVADGINVPFEVSTIDEFIKIKPNSNYVLVNDLVLYNYEMRDFEYFGAAETIGENNHGFDGNYHTITIYGAGNYNKTGLGLFNKIGASGVIKNLNVVYNTELNTSLALNWGGVATQNFGTIENTKVTFISSKLTTSAALQFGGIVAVNDGNISGCQVSGSLSVFSSFEESSKIGGIAAVNNSDKTITGTYSASSTEIKFGDSGYDVSLNLNVNFSKSNINAFVGGAVAENEGTVENVNAKGTIKTTSNVSGGVYAISNGGTQTNCYSIAVINETSQPTSDNLTGISASAKDRNLLGDLAINANKGCFVDNNSVLVFLNQNSTLTSNELTKFNTHNISDFFDISLIGTSLTGRDYRLYLQSSNSNIIKINDDGTFEVLGRGYTTISIISYEKPSISASVMIYVVYGINEYNIYSSSSKIDVLEELEIRLNDVITLYSDAKFVQQTINMISENNINVGVKFSPPEETDLWLTDYIRATNSNQGSSKSFDVSGLTNSITASGKTDGFMEILVTPFIKINVEGVNKIIYLNSLAKNIGIKVIGGATKISFEKEITEVKIKQRSVQEIVVIVETDDENEMLSVLEVNKVSDITNLAINNVSTEVIRSDGDSGKVTAVKFVYNIRYRGEETISQITSFDVKFSVAGNTNLNKTFKITIEPQDIDSVEFEFYSRLIQDEENGGFKIDNTAEKGDLIYYGMENSGLLKLFVYPDYANYGSLRITTNWGDKISIQPAYVAADGKLYTLSSNYVSTIPNGKSVKRSAAIFDSGKDENNTYSFRQVYYFVLTLTSEIGDLTEISFDVKFYKENTMVRGLKTSEKFSLFSMEIQEINMYVKDSLLTYDEISYLPFGTKTEININSDGMTGDPTFKVYKVGYKNQLVNYIYVIKDTDQKYYIVVEYIEGILGQEFIVEAEIYKTINGTSKLFTDKIQIQVTGYTIRGISVLNLDSNGILNALIKQNTILRVVFDVYYGKNTEYVSQIEAKINSFQNSLARNTIWKDVNGETLSDGNYPKFRINYEQGDYYKIYGNVAEVETPLKMDATISYENGYPKYHTPGIQFTQNFKVLFEEQTSLLNSVPIEDAEDFLNMEAGKDYILVNDIVLGGKDSYETIKNGYTPISTAIGSLDGNGKTIYIVKIAGEVSNVALFNTLSANTKIMNLNVMYANEDNISSQSKTITNNGTDYTYNGIVLSENNIAPLIIDRTASSANTSFAGIATTSYGIITNSKVGGRVQVKITEQINTNIATAAGIVLTNEGFITNSKVINLDFSGYGQIAGFVYINNNKITASAFDNSKITNVSPSTESLLLATAGFVYQNNGKISSCYAQGIKLGTDTTIKYTGGGIAASGRAAGFAFINTEDISNCYTNVTISSSTYSAGFVYENREGASVYNCYSTSNVKTNDRTVSNFTGFDNNWKIFSAGNIEKSYYLSSAGARSENEKAISLTGEEFGITASFPTFNINKVLSGADNDKYIWIIKDGSPKLSTFETVVESIRIEDKDQLEREYNDEELNFSILESRDLASGNEVWSDGKGNKLSLNVINNVVNSARLNGVKISNFYSYDNFGNIDFENSILKNYTLNVDISDTVTDTVTNTVTNTYSFIYKDIYSIVIQIVIQNESSNKSVEVFRNQTKLENSISELNTSNGKISFVFDKEYFEFNIVEGKPILSYVAGYKFTEVINETHYYKQVSGNDEGSQKNPYLIYDYASYEFYFGELYTSNVNNNEGKYFRFIADVDLFEKNVITAYTVFKGNIDGNNMSFKKVALLYNWNKTTENDYKDSFGIFAQLDGASIKNLNIELIEVKSANSRYVGSLAGSVTGSLAGSVTGSVTGSTYLNYINVTKSTEVNDAQNVGFVLGARYVGGVVGYATGDFKFSNIYSSVSANSTTLITPETSGQIDFYYGNELLDTGVIADASYADASYAGGAFGVLDAGSKNDNGNVENVYVTGEISVAGRIVGGVIGLVGNNTKVKNINFELLPVESGGSVQKLQANYYTGGLVGENRGDIEIAEISYAPAVQAIIDATNIGAVNAQSNLNLFVSPTSKNEYVTSVAAGGIVGLNIGGTINKALSKVDVRNINAQIAGGGIGRMVGGDLKEIVVTGSVKAAFIMGGLVGVINDYEHFETKFVRKELDDLYEKFDASVISVNDNGINNIDIYSIKNAVVANASYALDYSYLLPEKDIGRTAASFIGSITGSPKTEAGTGSTTYEYPEITSENIIVTSTIYSITNPTQASNAYFILPIAYEINVVDTPDTSKVFKDAILDPVNNWDIIVYSHHEIYSEVYLSIEKTLTFDFSANSLLSSEASDLVYEKTNKNGVILKESELVIIYKGESYSATVVNGNTYTITISAETEGSKLSKTKAYEEIASINEPEWKFNIASERFPTLVKYTVNENWIEFEEEPKTISLKYKSNNENFIYCKLTNEDANYKFIYESVNKEKLTIVVDYENGTVEAYKDSIKLTNVISELLKEENKVKFKFDEKNFEFNNKTYVVSTPEELAWIAQQVNSGNNLSGKTIELTNDIDLSGRYWTPIGTEDYPFDGTFNGNGYTIKYATVDGVANLKTTYDYAGIFGYANEATIKNVTTYGGSITGNYAGGIVGYFNSGTLDDNINNNIVNAHICGGGVAAEVVSETITNNTNNATVTYLYSSDTDVYIGGVFGSISATSSNSVNTGKINLNKTYADAENNIISMFVGGISGKSTAKTVTSKNEKTGTINVYTNAKQVYVGGICGENTNTDGVVNGYNLAEIYVNYKNSEGNNFLISDNAVLNVGGVAGYATTITMSYNTAKVSVEISSGDAGSVLAAVGGVVGKITTNISQSYNLGNVYSKKSGGLSAAFIGGLVGITFGGTTTTIIENCYNMGDITASGISSYAGGLLGAVVKNVEVTVDSESHYYYYVGEDVGFTSQILPYSTTTISDSTTDELTEINNAYNIGQVEMITNLVKITNLNDKTKVKYSMAAGGIVGYNYNLTLENVYYLEGVATADYLGGVNISGKLDEKSKTSTELKNLENLKFNPDDETDPEEIIWENTYSTWFPTLKNNNSVNLWADRVNTLTGAIGYFAISTEEQLAYVAKSIAEGKTYKGVTLKLMNNLDLSNRYWTPIGTEDYPFDGIFDGNGFIIKNLTVDGNIQATTYGGLFGYVRNATIQNLGLVDTIVKNVNVAAAVAAYATSNNDKSVNITNTFVDVSNDNDSIPANIIAINIGTGDDIITGTAAGAIAVINGKVNINKIYVRTAISGTTKGLFAGYVGANESINIENSYAITNADATIDFVGLEDIANSKIIDKVYSLNISDFRAEVVNNPTGNNPTISTPTFNELVQSYSGFSSWDFRDIWVLNEYNMNGFVSESNNVAPSIRGLGQNWLNEEAIKPGIKSETIGETTINYYEIKDKFDLVWLLKAVNINGLNTSGLTFRMTTEINLSGKFWIPIGTESNPFRGTFEFDGKNLIGMIVDSTTLNYGGLFGYTNGATIIGATQVEDSETINPAKIQNGFIKINNQLSSRNVYAGAIVGYAVDTEISYIESYLNIYANSKLSNVYVGGIAGMLSSNNKSSKITDVYVKGNSVSVDLSESVYANVFPKVDGDYKETVMIGSSNIYPVYNVVGTSEYNTYVGGIVGYTIGRWSNDMVTTISNSNNEAGILSFSLVKNVAASYYSFAGGIVGYATENSFITNVQNGVSLTGITEGSSVKIIKAYNSSRTILGGIVGYINSSELKKGSNYIYFETSYGIVTLGGIVGWAKYITVDLSEVSQNEGGVVVGYQQYNDLRIGGVIGYLEPDPDSSNKFVSETSIERIKYKFNSTDNFIVFTKAIGYHEEIDFDDNLYFETIE